MKWWCVFDKSNCDKLVAAEKLFNRCTYGEWKLKSSYFLIISVGSVKYFSFRTNFKNIFIN